MITVAKLHKLLGAMVESGHGRKPVCISKETFRHRLESDGATVLGVEYVEGPVLFLPPTMTAAQRCGLMVPKRVGWLSC